MNSSRRIESSVTETWRDPCLCCHGPDLESRSSPGGIPPDATRAAAEGVYLGAPAGLAQAAIPVGEAAPVVLPEPVLNPAVRCRADSDNSDVAPEHCGCYYPAAADVRMERSTAADPAVSSPAAVAASSVAG